jgi:phage shock protein C
MTCYNCQKDILEGSRYCYYCGAAQKPVNQPPPPPPRPAQPLRRSRRSKMIAGVCGGLAEHFALDISLVRIVWAVVTVLSGIFGGLVAYIICWIIIPEEEIQSSPAAPAPPQPSGS